jgi:riboflavin kinase/FMN adenylyltransferase
MPSVSFLGHRETTDGSFAVESHVVDQDIGVVGGRVKVAFAERIRANRRFDGLDALRDQIGRDIAEAKRIFYVR